MRLVFLALLAAVVPVGCGALIALDNYRECSGDSECSSAAADAGSSSSSSSGGDAGVDGDAETDAPISNDTCKTLADCPAGKGTTMCTSAGTCRRVVSLARGMSSHQCVLLDDGGVVCWGTNDAGQLGDPGPSRKEPKLVADIPPMIAVTMGNDHTCTLAKNGYVYCWGLGTSGGGSATPSPVTLPPESPAVQISSAQGSACALLLDHRIYCWGTNVYGEYGCSGVDAGACEDDAGAQAIVPTAGTTAKPFLLSDGKEDYTRIAAGLYASCAEIGTVSGHAHCWGNQIFGGLGDGTLSQGDSCCAAGDPAPPSHGGELQRLEASDFYTCRKDSIGDWNCWGWDTFCAFAQLGNCNQVVANPVFLGNDNASGPANLSPGWRHLCYTKKLEKGVWCRGDNEYGIIGDGKSSNGGTSVPPTKVLGLSPTANVVDIASHRHFSCALQDDGQVMCWGASDTGQLLGLNAKSVKAQATGPVGWGTP